MTQRHTIGTWQCSCGSVRENHATERRGWAADLPGIQWSCMTGDELHWSGNPPIILNSGFISMSLVAPGWRSVDTVRHSQAAMPPRRCRGNAYDRCKGTCKLCWSAVGVSYELAGGREGLFLCRVERSPSCVIHNVSSLGRDCRDGRVGRFLTEGFSTVVLWPEQHRPCLSVPHQA
jgi:hypothetical protein